jgi:hypothetical protein
MSNDAGGGVHENAFVVLLPVGVVRAPEWLPGPLVRKYMPGTAHEIISDTRGRAKYIPGEQLSDLLYGRTDNPRRWHKELQSEHPVTTNRGVQFLAHFEAVEVVRYTELASLGGFALFHGTIRHDDLRVLKGVVELANVDPVHGTVVRGLYQSLLGAHVFVSDQIRRARLLTMVCGAADGLPSVATNLEGGWSRRDQWLWHLATCHMPNTITVGRESLTIVRDRQIHVSDEWKGFVAREGAAYVANSHSELVATLEQAVEQREIRIRSMEADALLLAELQDSLSSRIVDGLFLSRRGVQTAVPIQSLLGAYRSMYWGERITERGYSNDLLLGLRRVKRLPERLTDLRLDVEDAGAEMAERAASTTNAALALLTVFGFPTGTALGIWSAVDTGHTWRGLFEALLAAMVMAAVLMLAFPGLRETLPKLFQER